MCIKKKTVIFSLLVSGFMLNFLWEIFQSLLYAPYLSGTIDLIAIYRASIVDVILVALIIVIDAIFLSKIFLNESSTCHRAGWKRIIGMTLVGFAVGVIVEKNALAGNRLRYNELMPIIPFLQVGLTPVLQMMLMPIILNYINLKPREE